MSSGFDKNTHNNYGIHIVRVCVCSETQYHYNLVVVHNHKLHHCIIYDVTMVTVVGV